MIQENKEKNLSIEALRILSMLLICIPHVLGRGGVLTGAEPRSMQYMLAWAIEAFATCSVNCYGLISGYVGVNSRFKWSRIVQVWLEVLFYELLISLYFQFRFPALMTTERWIAAFTPILSGEYWYISSYAGMFLFVPVLNAALNTLTKRRLEQILAAIFVLLVLLSTVFGIDVFGLLDGYCMLWLCILYLFGGYIRKYVVISGRKKWWLLPVMLVSSILSWLSPMMGDARFIDFTSPTVFVTALALTLFVANTEFRGKTLKKLILLLSPATLGVYLIHGHPLVFNNYIAGCALGFVDKPSLLMALYVFLLALGIYLVCSFVDLIRIKIFKLLRVKQATDHIDLLLADKENGGGAK